MWLSKMRCVPGIISGVQSTLRLLGRNGGAEMPISLSSYVVMGMRSVLPIACLCFSSLPVEGGIAFSYFTAYFRCMGLFCNACH